MIRTITHPVSQVTIEEEVILAAKETKNMNVERHRPSKIHGFIGCFRNCLYVDWHLRVEYAYLPGFVAKTKNCVRRDFQPFRNIFNIWNCG